MHKCIMSTRFDNFCVNNFVFWEECVNQAHIVMDIRNSLRMNQREIADYLGVSPSVISNVESGSRQISKSLQALLVEKLNVNPHYLLT